MDQADYDKIKADYKEHFKKMKELKDRLAQAKHTQRISKAIQDMDPQPVLDSVDEMVEVLREKVSLAEAKLSIALDSVFESGADQAENELNQQQKAEFEAELKKQQAKQAVAKMKAEMSSDTIHERKEDVDDKPISKTIGATMQEHVETAEKHTAVKKTIGPKE